MRQFWFLLLVSSLSTSLFAQKINAPLPAANSSQPQSVFEKVNIQLPQDADAETVGTTLAEIRPWTQAPGCGLALDYERSSPGGFHYNFHQTYRGIPIYHHSIKANLNLQKRITSLMDNLHTVDINNLRDFVLTETEVSNWIEATFDQGQPDFEYRLAPYWFHDNGQLIGIYKVEYYENTHAWEILVDAQSMAELKRRDMAVYHRHTTGTDIDSCGQGMVFNPDPLTTAGVTYGGNYVDNNDADIAELNAQRIQVKLQDIEWNGTHFLLEGPYVSLEDLENPFSGVVTSLDGNFMYTRREQGFEDVMCYYHIDTYQRYLQSIGFTNLYNQPLKVDPHGLNSTDNSHFVPNGSNSRLGFGEGGVDDAEDADVIIHEYGHAVSFSAAPGSNSGTERMGLDEGIGDYMAASYSRSISWNLWKNTFTWDGHNEFWPGRSASVGTLYPSGSSDIYVNGALWASAMMEIFDDEGRTVTDRIFFQSLYGNVLNMTLSDAASLVLEADSALYNGAHTPTIQRVFCERGLFTGAQPGQQCFVSSLSPTEVDVRWTIYPNPTSGEGHIFIDGFSGKDDYAFQVVNAVGQVVASGPILRARTDVSLAAYPAGMYHVRLHVNGVHAASRALVKQ